MVALRNFLIILTAFTLLQGCKRVYPDKVEASNGDTFTRYKYHENGVVRLSTQFLLLDDSTEKPVGYEKTFYQSGKLKGYSLNVPATQKGNYTMYYQTGEFYFENGVVSNKFNSFDSKLVGEQVSYYPNGKLKSVRVYNGNGTLAFRMTFDINGQVLKKGGYPYMYWKTGKRLKVGEDFGLNMNVVMTDQLKTIGVMKIISPSGKSYNANMNFKDFFGESTFSHNSTFSEQGDHIYTIDLKLVDTLLNKVLYQEVFNDTVKVYK